MQLLAAKKPIFELGVDMNIMDLLKKLPIFLLLSTHSVLALKDNPAAPPNVQLTDEFDVNIATGQLGKILNTVAIGGGVGLSHHIQLYSDLWTTQSFYGFVDKFAGHASMKKISDNTVYIGMDGDAILFFRVSDTREYNINNLLYVMRVYGPTGSQDFVIYKDEILYGPDPQVAGYTYRAVGDTRHLLVESSDKRFLTWISPEGTETTFERSAINNWTAGTGANLREITYPNGLKIRISNNAVSTNTGFMLKYHFTSGWRTPKDVIGINLTRQYCAADAVTCSTSGWPKASFIWPTGAPNVFRQPGLSSSNYLFKVIDQHGGSNDIQYRLQNVCIMPSGEEDAACAANPPFDGSKWSARLANIKTSESIVPNLDYTYKNIGDYGQYHPYWNLHTKAGQIVTATLNGTEKESYGGPTTHPGWITRNSGQVSVQSARYEVGVIEQVQSIKQGSFYFHRDLRRFVEKHYPIAGQGPAKHYYYDGPRGNVNRINVLVSPTEEIPVMEAGYADVCIYSKICNQPLWTKDAKGNVTNYEYDPQGRFGDPVKVIGPADDNGIRKATVYKYEPLYAFYKRSGESITRDPDPVWLLTREHTCRTSGTTNIGCSGGDVDMIKTEYYYGPQSAAYSNNLHLRGKSITAEGNNGTPETRVWCYEYDKFGNMIGETQPKGNSTDLELCP